MKNIFIYIIILVAIFILSDFLMFVGLNSMYKDIERQDNNSQISVYQAQATYVNGRIRGMIKDTTKVSEKYLEVELYSKRDVLMGRRYIEINGNDENVQAFQVLFKAKDVKYYKINTVDEKKEGPELEILSKEWTKPEIILATIVTFLIFWG